MEKKRTNCAYVHGFIFYNQSAFRYKLDKKLNPFSYARFYERSLAFFSFFCLFLAHTPHFFPHHIYEYSGPLFSFSIKKIKITHIYTHMCIYVYMNIFMLLLENQFYNPFLFISSHPPHALLFLPSPPPLHIFSSFFCVLDIIIVGINTATFIRIILYHT